MPPGGSRPGLRSLSASSDAQMKMPELPALFSCRQRATSSKLVYGFFVRHTPIGLPVQCTLPSCQVQVSLSQLTLTKSSAPSGCQPGPVPSMNALGGPAGWSAETATETRMSVRQKMTSIRNGGAFIGNPPPGRTHLHERPMQRADCTPREGDCHGFSRPLRRPSGNPLRPHISRGQEHHVGLPLPARLPVSQEVSP